MRHSLLTTIVLGLLAAVGPRPLPATPILLHLSPNGNDAWSGRIDRPNAGRTDGPFATFRRARDEIRRVKAATGLPTGGIVVEARAGRYPFDETLELTNADSGTADAPIAYRARAGEIVRISGGRPVTAWKPVTDPPTIARLDPSARGKVYRAALRALGITEYGDLGGGFGQPTRLRLELFFNDAPMPIARGPNDGFIEIAEVLGATPREVRGRKGCVEGRFRCGDDRLHRWAGEEDIWVLGYWFTDWAEQRHRVRSLDPATGIIEVEEPYHSYGYRKGQWFYGYNILAEIDRPGEWQIDRKTGTLYFWPPRDLAHDARVEVSVAGDLVAMTDVSHVALRGLVFEATRGTALSLRRGTGCSVVGCTFRNLGANAVNVSGGTDHSVVGCDMYEMGGGGVSLSGGDLKTLAPAGHSAENNHIHHFSRWDRMYRPGVRLSGVGNRAAHNLIHNAPHMAVGFGGVDHRVECNEIHSVCYESNDCGAIYAGRSWTSRAHLLRHNYLHHIYGREGRACVGIYLDDMFSSATLYGNVFYQVTRAAFIGGGRDNTVENNIFVDCPRAMHIDCRALGWAAPTADRWILEARTKNTIEGIRYRQPPYGTRFPQLAAILEHDPKAPCGNVVRRNIFWAGTGADIRRAAAGAEPRDDWWDSIAARIKPLVRVEDNLINVDPHFAAPPPASFVLRADSPALKLGFEPIPFETIGLRKDPTRASWPVVHTVRPMPAPILTKPDTLPGKADAGRAGAAKRAGGSPPRTAPRADGLGLSGPGSGAE